MAWAINLYWFALALGTAVLGGLAVGRPRAAIVAGEIVTAVTVLHAVWPVLGPPLPTAAPGPGSPAHSVSWRLAFTDLD